MAIITFCLKIISTFIIIQVSKHDNYRATVLDYHLPKILKGL